MHTKIGYQQVSGGIELAGQSSVSDAPFHQWYQATPAAPLVACSATSQLQTGGHPIGLQNEISWQSGLPTSSLVVNV